MKSERASACLEECAIRSRDPYIGRFVRYDEAATCIDIAEKETEERVRKEMKRWHDPTKKLPNSYEATLVKVRGVERDLYHVLYYADCKWWHCKCSLGCVPHYYEEFNGCVIGWRYIHE